MPVIRFNGAKLDPETIRSLVAETLIEGNATSKWWTLQSADFLETFMGTIRTSMNNGESLQQAITRIVGGTVDGVSIPGILNISKKKAGALAATSINAVSNNAALASFQANADVIKWVSQVSTLDNKTSDICIAYSGQTWDVNTLEPVNGSELPFNGGPPRHFNCRSRLRPVTKSFRELGFDLDEIPTGMRASMDGLVPADITFSKWLGKKSEAFQNKLLGPGRARLWRENKITLTQLVDMRGNPMTLTQLEQKVGLKPIPPTVATVPPISMHAENYVEYEVPGYGERVFAKARVDRNEILVVMDKELLEELWSRDQGYIPPDLSKNTIGNRIDGFKAFLKDNKYIEVGNVHVGDGYISFGNGRHRTRVLINAGMRRIPVTMSRESFDRLIAGRKHKVVGYGSDKARERIALLQQQQQQRQIEKFKKDKEKREKEKAQKEKAELDEKVITDPKEIPGEAFRFLRARGLADEEIIEHGMDMIALLSNSETISWTFANKKALEKTIRERIEAKLKRQALAEKTSGFGKPADLEDYRDADGTMKKALQPEEEMLMNAFGTAITPAMRRTIMKTPKLKYMILDQIEHGISKTKKEAAKRGAAWYNGGIHRIIAERRGRPDVSYFGTLRHEYGHAIDYGSFANFYKYLERTGKFPDWMKSIKKVRYGHQISYAFSGHMTRIVRKLNKKLKKMDGGVYHQQNTLAEKHVFAAKAETMADLDAYYEAKFKKYGVSWAKWKEMARRDFDSRTNPIGPLPDEEMMKFLPHQAAHLLASFEMGHPGAILDILTQSQFLLKGGGTMGKLSDYFSAVTSNRVRGQWGHSNDYYTRRGARETEAFANAITMLGDAGFEDLWKQLLKAWDSDDFILEVEKMLDVFADADFP